MAVVVRQQRGESTRVGRDVCESNAVLIGWTFWGYLQANMPERVDKELDQVLPETKAKYYNHLSPNQSTGQRAGEEKINHQSALQQAFLELPAVPKLLRN